MTDLYDDKTDLYDDMTDLYDDMTDLYDDMTGLYVSMTCMSVGSMGCVQAIANRQDCYSWTKGELTNKT